MLSTINCEISRRSSFNITPRKGFSLLASMICTTVGRSTYSNTMEFKEHGSYDHITTNDTVRRIVDHFVIRYRTGSQQRATEDLAAAIAYIFRNAAAIGVSTEGYSLWGGSAGARMVGNIALSGVAAYGGGNLAKPAVAVIAYTGQSSFSEEFPPTFITVSANDDIANAALVDKRVENLRNAGVEVEYRRYRTAGHGFGLGTGTDAEGWSGHAVRFWEKHLSKGH